MIGSDSPQLNLYYRKQLVGSVVFNSERRCAFVYADDWEKNGFAISPHLPLQAKIEDTAINRFLHNLFPEGSAFERLLETQHLSKHNFYAILKTIGHDTAGALTFLPDGHNTKDALRLIQTDELVTRLQDETRQNLAFWDGKFRLSVAGVQNKLNVFCKQDNLFYLADGHYASTHILKFASQRFPNIVLNEFFTMHLAKAVDLPVAEVELIAIGDYRALKVTRFDRKLSNNTVLKRHMIDGCQALNLSPESKYEQNFGGSKDVAHIREGASLAKLFTFAENTAVPADSKQKLMDWVLFNLLVGNSDAHGKNISFYVGKNAISLAPFYDLVSVVFEQQFNAELETSLAMAIDDNFDINQIQIYDLIALAETVGFDFGLLKRRLERMLKLFEVQIEKLEFEQITVEEQACLQQYKVLLKTRLGYFVEALGQFDEVCRAAF